MRLVFSSSAAPESRRAAIAAQGPFHYPESAQVAPEPLTGTKEISVMAKFCGSCGAQLGDAASFCLQCGAPQSATPPQPAQPQNVAPVNPPPSQPAFTPVNTPQPVQYAPVNPPQPNQYAPVNPPGGNAPPAYSGYPPAAKKSGSGIKIVLAILAVLFIGAIVVVGGLLYAGHKVYNKVKTAAAENGLSLPSSESSSSEPAAAASSATHTDYCALLSKDDVSAAIGVPIVATQNTDTGCEYLAHGTASDMTARHATAMVTAKGADSQSQDMIHQMAGAIFKQSQEENHAADADANGNTPVLMFGIDSSGARERMKLSQKTLGLLGPTGATPISGIGDEAFDSSGAMMFIRKGDKLLQITYMTCPCNTEAIKPLARKLADAI